MSEGIALPPPESAPKRIGKYRILRQIAQGGMAEIYLASASGIEGFEKLCVLKRILPLLATNREFVQMFLDEARIAASLMHSNIAQVFDIGSENGNYYFVMEFLRGEDVRHILQSSVERKTFVPYEHIVSMIAGVCSGLHYAHEMRGKDGKPLQLVHRDISPQNVFVTHDGNVKLCDFGIAKSAAQLTETRVGTLKGKIRYMSPEQCRSEPLDRRSDVFALSIVLWELVTLRRLFTGKSDFEIFKAIVEEPTPSPSAFRRDVPPGLEAIIMKGLRRDREQRFQTAQELQLALEDWARVERIPASSVGLATFMTELFGPPAAAAESFLERVSEDDPLAKRIRSLNEGERSDPDVVDEGPQADRTRLDRVAASPGTESRRKFDELGGGTDAGSLEVGIDDEPASGMSRPAPRLLIVLATALCLVAIAALVLYHPAHRDPAGTTSVDRAEPTPAPATAPKKLVSPAADGLAAPTAPPIRPQRAIEPPAPPPASVAAKPPSHGSATRPKARPAKKVDAAAGRKRGALDELLPP